MPDPIEEAATQAATRLGADPEPEIAPVEQIAAESPTDAKPEDEPAAGAEPAVSAEPAPPVEELVVAPEKPEPPVVPAEGEPLVVEAGKGGKIPQARLNREILRRREAEEEAERLRQELATMQSQPQAPRQPERLTPEPSQIEPAPKVEPVSAEPELTEDDFATIGEYRAYQASQEAKRDAALARKDADEAKKNLAELQQQFEQVRTRSDQIAETQEATHRERAWEIFDEAADTFADENGLTLTPEDTQILKDEVVLQGRANPTSSIEESVDRACKIVFLDRIVDARTAKAVEEAAKAAEELRAGKTTADKQERQQRKADIMTTPSGKPPAGGVPHVEIDDLHAATQAAASEVMAGRS